MRWVISMDRPGNHRGPLSWSDGDMGGFFEPALVRMGGRFGVQCFALMER